MKYDLGPLPSVNPRDEVVSAARSALTNFLCEFASKHGLTSAEFLELLADYQAKRLQALIRSERRNAGQKE